MGNYYKYTKGLGNVNSYKISGIPYATGSITVEASTGGTPTRVEFPNVTKFVTVQNEDAGGTIRVGFSEAGVTGSINNYYGTVGAQKSITFDVRVKEIYLLADGGSAIDNVSVVAGLTGISNIELPTNWSGSVGVL